MALLKRAASSFSSSQPFFLVSTIVNSLYCLFFFLNINQRCTVECWLSHVGSIRNSDKDSYGVNTDWSSCHPARTNKSVGKRCSTKMRYDYGGLTSRNETTSPEVEDSDDNYYKKYHGKLCSPYDESHKIIQSLVNLRSQARNQKNYSQADSILQQLESLSVDRNNTVILPGYKLSLKDTISGSTMWDIVPSVPFPIPPQQLEETDWNIKQSKENCTVLQLAHMALGLAIFASINTTTDTTPTRSSTDFTFNNEGPGNTILLERAEKRLMETQGTDLYGRAAADAAFWFALAYNNPHDHDNNNDNNSTKSIYYNSLYDRLMEYLVHISTNELLRYGTRPSCAPKHILHIVERFAAAGLAQSPSVQKLHRVAADYLELKVNSFPTTSSSSSSSSSSGGGDSHNTITKTKNNYRNIIQSLREGTFDMHSERPLLLLWKFSTKQRKQRVFADSAVRHVIATYMNNNTDPSSSIRRSKNMTQNAAQIPSPYLEQDSSFNKSSWWYTHFDDPNKPLVIDIGCGMGISALGLASITSSSQNVYSFHNIHQHTNDNHFEKTLHDQSEMSCFLNDNHTYFADCNFAGVDLSRLAIGYASGVAHRLGLRKKKVHFFVSSAEDFMTLVVDSYPGKVKLVMIQFPTPFRYVENAGRNQDLESHEPILSGNSQLPSNDSNDGFMVTKRLLTIISTALKNSGGHLLLQSNCEDVAVGLRKMASQEAGFQCLDVTSLHCAEDHDERVERKRMPQRTQRYVSEGGERAIGSGWSQYPILPKRGSTETETACEFNGTPIHRCLLAPQS